MKHTVCMEFFVCSDAHILNENINNILLVHCSHLWTLGHTLFVYNIALLCSVRGGLFHTKLSLPGWCSGHNDQDFHQRGPLYTGVYSEGRGLGATVTVLHLTWDISLFLNPIFLIVNFFLGELWLVHGSERAGTSPLWLQDFTDALWSPCNNWYMLLISSIRSFA